MKKLTFLIALLGASLTAMMTTSCSDPVSVDSIESRTMQVTVHSDEWSTYDQNGVCYQYVEVNWPFLTEQVLNYGSVVAYVYEGTMQEPLPYIFPMPYDVPNGTGGYDQVIVPQNVRFDFEVGKIYFIREDLDGGMVGNASAPMVFRAVANYPVRYTID